MRAAISRSYSVRGCLLTEENNQGCQCTINEW